MLDFHDAENFSRGLLTPAVYSGSCMLTYQINMLECRIHYRLSGWGQLGLPSNVHHIALYRTVILYMLPSLVHSTVLSAFKCNINLKFIHPGQ
jgi:hypothetical protein